MEKYFLIIKHCNGEIMEEPFIVNDEKVLNYMNGEYLVYQIMLPKFILLKV